MRSIYIIIFFNVFAFVYQVNAQMNTIEIYGTKSNALGQVTSVHTGINSAYTNQAGLAFLTGTKINIGYENRFQVFELSALNLAIAKNIQNLGTFGITIKRFGFSAFNEYQFGFSYAMKLSNKFAVGLQFDVFNTSISGYGNKTIFSFETGAIYNLSDKLITGIHITNPFPIKFLENQNIPTIVNLGVKYKISDFLSIYAEFEKHIEHNFFLKSGIEYSPIKVFVLYFGFKNDFSNYADYSFGFKYEINRKMSIELSTLYNITLGLSPSVGFNYDI